MRRFYLHFLDENGSVRDEEGFEAADCDAARLLGMKAAGEIVADYMAGGRSNIAFMLCLDDQDRKRVATLPVTATVAAFFKDPVAVA
jgi:hypothetical protein